MAILAKGDPFPDCTTMVSPPASRENTWASSADSPTPAEPSIPIPSPYGTTQTTIGSTVANSPSQCFDNPHQHPHHHDWPLPVFPPSEPPALSSNITHPVLLTHSRIDLDALIEKVSRSLREDFLHLPAADDYHDNANTPFQCLQQATLDPNLLLVNLDVLERKICCQGLF